jgi:hypothetical protein
MPASRRAERTRAGFRPDSPAGVKERCDLDIEQRPLSPVAHPWRNNGKLTVAVDRLGASSLGQSRMLHSRLHVGRAAGWIASISVALTAVGCGSSSVVPATSSSAATPAAKRPAPSRPQPPKTVTGQHARSTGARPLPVRTRLASSTLGARVFADTRHGFALATTVRLGGQTYPAATTDGGRTWRVNGPIFHIPAAQAALGVGQPGLAGPHAFFTWSGGENSVIDMTVDGGHQWWRTLHARNSSVCDRRPSLRTDRGARRSIGHSACGRPHR